ncbi:MAG: hypothetical protein HYY57_07720, partial [Candidatus Omnitrophica bacterium]|nr:hypothetical protein [Candidatus Omnitrophota bacterium]
MERWIYLKRTKAFCIGLAVLFGLEQAVWGADINAIQTLMFSSEQQRQLDTTRSAAIVTIYDDLYGRLPTEEELKQSLEFLRRSPQMAYLIERLAQSPESRWKLRQLNPERIAARKAEAARISRAVGSMVGDFLRNLQTHDSRSTTHEKLRESRVEGRESIQIVPGLTVVPPTPALAQLNETEIQSFETWLKDENTLCSNCASNALAPMLEMVGRSVSRETLTAQAFLVDYLSGNLQLKSDSRLTTHDSRNTADEELRESRVANHESNNAPTRQRANALTGPLYISMSTVQQLAKAYGLTLNAVELTADELFLIRHPMIAALDLTQDGAADHYVVVQDANEARIIYYESDGTREHIPTHEFLRLFTGFALLAAPEVVGTQLSQEQAFHIYGGRVDEGTTT